MNAYFLRIAILICCATGCSSSSTPTATQPSRQTYHLHLPGIAGRTVIHDWWCYEVRSCVPGMQSELYDWTGHAFMIDVLQDYEKNHEEAKKIAARIVEKRRANPDLRIVITAESGGTGPAVWMLEDLPGDLLVDEVVLISSALSPDYDLSRALRHVRGAMYVFNSDRDNFILGWGTETYGTIDGKRSQSAGRYGFVKPESADAAQYAKLIQVPYRSEWWKYLNFGGHAAAMSPSFGKNVIGPLLLSGAVPPPPR